MNEFMNKHAGEICVVIGNGPSLRDVPLSFLKKYPSFGTNRIYLLDGFTATYYVSVNPLVIQQSEEEINAYGARAKFIDAQYARLIDGSYPLVNADAQLFSFNPSAYINQGFTVTFVCLQLAFLMGFSTVLLVGVDHRYKMDGDPNSETTWQGDDPNHFTPEYFKDTRWNNPDLERSRQAYVMAKKAFEENGRRIINLTKDSALDVFQKDKLSKWMQPPASTPPKRAACEKETKVSAVVSAYFAERYLEGRIQNLLEQKPQPEIVVVCRTGSVEHEIASKVGGVKIVQTEDIPTVYAAWNLGIQASTGEYITNANSDDRLYPSALHRLAEVLDADKSIAVAYFDVDLTRELGGLPFGRYEWLEGGLPELLNGCFLGPMPMWRKSLHEKYGWFDADMHSAGDYEFWLRLARGGEKFKRIRQALGVYLYRDDSAEHRQRLRSVWETARARARYRAGVGIWKTQEAATA